jgi:hypothetical protein
MFLTIGFDEGSGMTTLETDYFPRGPNPLGSDPRYIEMYYDDIFSNERLSFEYLPPPPSFYARLLQSPAYLSIAGLGLGDVEGLATTHVDRWLSWMTEPATVDSRQKASYNTRDDKLRQFSYRSKYELYMQHFDSKFALQLAAANTGPVAEAYVGQAS